MDSRGTNIQDEIDYLDDLLEESTDGNADIILSIIGRLEKLLVEPQDLEVLPDFKKHKKDRSRGWGKYPFLVFKSWATLCSSSW